MLVIAYLLVLFILLNSCCRFFCVNRIIMLRLCFIISVVLICFLLRMFWLLFSVLLMILTYNSDATCVMRQWAYCRIDS